MERRIFLSIAVLFLLAFKSDWGRPHYVSYIVPEQQFDLAKEIGLKKAHDTVSVPEFEISPQIRLWEYKEYLAAIKKDSSEAFYQSQLPDTTMCLPDAYNAYFNSTTYDEFPVIGISWDNACYFLRWKTITANKDGICDTIYRLPLLSEWVAAWRSFQTQPALKDEMNSGYADWTLQATDESWYFDEERKNERLDYTYMAEKKEAPVLQRKVALGNSFHFAQPTMLSFMGWGYYEFHGYAHISFRYVTKIASKKDYDFFFYTEFMNAMENKTGRKW